MANKWRIICSNYKTKANGGLFEESFSNNSKVRTAQKMKFFIKDFFSKCDLGHIYWRNP